MSMNVSGTSAASYVDIYGTDTASSITANEGNIFYTDGEAEVDGYYGTTSSVASKYSSATQVNGTNVDLSVSLSSVDFKTSTARISGNTYTNVTTQTTGTVDDSIVTSTCQTQVQYYTDADGNVTGIKSISFCLDGDGSTEPAVSLTYDQDGNLTSETRGYYTEKEVDGETTYVWTNDTTSYNYDEDGNLTSVLYSDGTTSTNQIAPDKAPSATNKSGLASLIADYSAQIFSQKVETTELQSKGKVSTKNTSSSSSSSSSSTTASNKQVKTWLESLKSSSDSSSFMYTVASFLLELWDLIDISSSDKTEEADETKETKDTDETKETEET